MAEDLGAVAPTRVEQRIDTLDLLRGVAICGILLMNIPSMGGVLDTQGLFYPARWNADWIGYVVQGLLFEGTMRGLFTMLFGAGMLLMLRHAEGARPQATPFDVWTRRCLALMALGVVQFALFLWPGEILFNYGVTGLFLLAFRLARPRTLLIWAAIVLAGMTLYQATRTYGRVGTLETSIAARAAKAAHQPLSKEQQAALDMMDRRYEGLHPSRAAMDKEIAERSRWPSVLAWSADEWSRNLQPDGWGAMAESLAFMLTGMALYRTGIFTGTASAATYRRLMVAGYGVGLALRGWMFWWQSTRGFDFDRFHAHMALSQLYTAAYEPARMAVTLGHVGLLVTLFRSGALGRAWPLRALGRMALTVYSLQSILTSILFYGFGTVGQFGFAALEAIAMGIWIVTGLFCLWWLRSHAMGPAEWLLRAVAYLSFRRHRPEAAGVLATAPAV